MAARLLFLLALILTMTWCQIEEDDFDDFDTSFDDLFEVTEEEHQEIKKEREELKMKEEQKES